MDQKANTLPCKKPTHQQEQSKETFLTHTLMVIHASTQSDTTKSVDLIQNLYLKDINFKTQITHRSK